MYHAYLRFKGHFFAALYLCSVLGFCFLAARSWHPVYGLTSLVQFSRPQTVLIPELRKLPLFLHPTRNTYDGVMYAQMAYDPLLNHPEKLAPPAVDNLPYRARRVLLSWLGWLLAAGDPSRIVYVFPYINFGFWFVLVGLLWRWFPPSSWHNAVAFFGVIFSEGVTQSIRFSLTDLPALTLAAAGLYLVERGRVKRGVGALAVAALSRETILGAAPALIWPEMNRRGILRAISLGIILLAPAAIWTFYVRIRVGSLSPGLGNFASPFSEYIAKWKEIIADPGNEGAYKWYSLLALIGLTTQAIWMVVRPNVQSAPWRFGILFVPLMFVLGRQVWEGYPGAAYRVLLPLQFAFVLCVPRTRLGLVVLVLGGLTVCSGLQWFRFPLIMGDEFVMYSDNGYLISAKSGPANWYERDLDAERTWAKGPAEIELALFKGENASIDVRFLLGAITDRNMKIVYEGQEVWSGRISGSNNLVHLRNLAVTSVPRSLKLISTEPPAHPVGSRDLRSLAFSVKDFRISLNAENSLHP